MMNKILSFFVVCLLQVSSKCLGQLECSSTLCRLVHWVLSSVTAVFLSAYQQAVQVILWVFLAYVIPGVFWLTPKVSSIFFRRPIGTVARRR